MCSLVSRSKVYPTVFETLAFFWHADSVTEKTEEKKQWKDQIDTDRIYN